MHVKSSAFLYCKKTKAITVERTETDSARSAFLPAVECHGNIRMHSEWNLCIILFLAVWNTAMPLTDFHLPFLRGVSPHADWMEPCSRFRGVGKGLPVSGDTAP